MALPAYIVTTCGISVFTQAASPEVRGLCFQYANEPPSQDPHIPQALREWLRQVEAEFPGVAPADAAARSAEIKCLLGLYDGQLGPAVRRDAFVLLHTDTELGTRAAAVIQKWLEQHGASQVELKRVVDLNTQSREGFRHGIQSLMAWLVDTAETRGWERPPRQERLVFNVAGGFKPFQGYLTILGMLYQAEVIYQFETGEELLTIPPLPGLDRYFNDNLKSLFQEHFLPFRRLRLEVATPEDLAALPETLVMRLDGETPMLSPWGELVWLRFHPALYREKLWPSPAEEWVRYGPSFRKTVEDACPPERLQQLNGQIDELVAYLKRRQTHPEERPLAKLHLRELKGNHRPSTHEIAAWHDQGAYRIFLHWDHSGVMLDALRPHL